MLWQDQTQRISSRDRNWPEHASCETNGAGNDHQLVQRPCQLRWRNFPRQRLGHLPTPLEPMDRLSEILGGPRLWVKRDDCTGLSSGGNKTRKLEFLMGEACQQGVRHNYHPRCHAVQSCAADGGGSGQAWAWLPYLARRPHGVQEMSLYAEWQCFMDRLHGASCPSALAVI